MSYAEKIFNVNSKFRNVTKNMVRSLQTLNLVNNKIQLLQPFVPYLSTDSLVCSNIYNNKSPQ